MPGVASDFLWPPRRRARRAWLAAGSASLSGLWRRPGPHALAVETSPPLPRERRPQRPQLAVSTAECPRHQATLLPLPLPREWVARVTFERSLTLNEASAGLCFTALPGDRACSVTWLSSCLCRPPPRGMACSPWTPCLPLVGFSRRKDQLRCNSIHTHTHALGEFCIEKKLQIRTMATAL